MAIIKAALLEALRVTFRGDFQKGLGEAETQWKEVAMLVPSSSKSNTYGWLGKMPRLREWVGDRVLNSIKEHGYSVLNKDFEATVPVDRNDIEDDELGIYGTLMQELGRSAAIHPDELVFGLLSKGDTTLCYDGQNFFDTDHPVYPKVDGTGTAATVSNADIDKGRTTPMWYLLDTSRSVKPLLYQERKKPEFVALTNPQNEDVFNKRLYKFGVDKRCNVGFAFWQMAYASNNTLNADNLWAAVSAMRAFEGDGGHKLGIKPTTLVVPVGLEKAALRLIERELESNSSNELKGRLKVVVGDYL